MPSLRLSQEFYLAVMQSEQVRAGLASRADKIADRARAATEVAEIDGEVRRVDGVRPKGRPYARVEHTNAAQEHGTSRVERRRILGSSR